MEKIIFASISSFLFTFFGTKYLRKYLENKKIFDIPIKRSSHAKPTPKGGGWIIVLTIVGIISMVTMRDLCQMVLVISPMLTSTELYVMYTITSLKIRFM